MDNKLLVSVIIPCFNQGQFIEETIDSVLNQSFQNFEIIVVNDGSTDEQTNQALATLNKPKTKVITINNGGSAVARNTGFKVSNGEYIQFLDADDLIPPEKFEKQLAFFEKKTEAKICYTSFEYCDIQGNIIQKNFPYSSDVAPNTLESLLFRWERGLSIAIHSFLIKKEIFNEDLPFDERLRAKEDWVLWCKLANQGYQFYYMPDIKVQYRSHDNNKMKNKELVALNFFKATTIILEKLKGKQRDDFLVASYKHISNTAAENSSYKNYYYNILSSRTYKIAQLLNKPLKFVRSLLK